MKEMRETGERTVEAIRAESLVRKLEAEHHLTEQEYLEILDGRDEELTKYVGQQAEQLCLAAYGRQVFIRGLIEVSNYCKNNCYYCGIRCGNQKAERYRLTEQEILDSCEAGWQLGFRTFVLQGGEDPWYRGKHASRVTEIVKKIKAAYPECAVTLSLGEYEEADYAAFRQAGADRYLLRHETNDPVHYGTLHPAELSLEHRKKCLHTLKQLGFQTGSGFMVGSPGQTHENLAKDLMFLQELQPQMVGIGPFIPHKDTPFGDQKAGSVELTLFLVSLIRLMLPNALIPATTALGTLMESGREKAMLCGANVIMPNLSPTDVRKKYTLYDNKLCTGDEAAESLRHLKERMAAIGREVVCARGDFAEAQ